MQCCRRERRGLEGGEPASCSRSSALMGGSRSQRANLDVVTCFRTSLIDPPRYRMIEAARPAPRCEMLARSSRKGWSVWRDEV